MVYRCVWGRLYIWFTGVYGDAYIYGLQVCMGTHMAYLGQARPSLWHNNLDGEVLGFYSYDSVFIFHVITARFLFPGITVQSSNLSGSNLRGLVHICISLEIMF